MLQMEQERMLHVLCKQRDERERWLEEKKKEASWLVGIVVTYQASTCPTSCSPALLGRSSFPGKARRPLPSGTLAIRVHTSTHARSIVVHHSSR